MDGDQIRAWRAAAPHEGRGAVSHTASIRGVGTPIIRGKSFKRGMNTKDKGTVLGLTNQGGGKQTSPLSDRKPSPCLRLPLRGRKVSVRSKGGRTQFAPTGAEVHCTIPTIRHRTNYNVVRRARRPRRAAIAAAVHSAFDIFIGDLPSAQRSIGDDAPYEGEMFCCGAR